MKKLQMVAIDEIELTNVPMPEPKAGEVLLKTRGAAVFRSEFIPLIHGEDPRTREGDFLFPSSGFPRGFGADLVAEVVDVGPDVTGVTVGERVGTSAQLGEYTVRKAGHLVRLAPHLSDVEATFPVHAGVVLHGVDKLRINLGDTGLVIGQGPLGVIACQLLKLAGCGEVIGADLYDGRLERARQCGVDHTINTKADDLQERVLELTGGKGADVVVEATAAAPCVEMALRAVRQHGQVLLLGFHGHPFTIDKPIENWLYKETTVIGTFASSLADWQTAADLQAQGRLVVKPLVSHEMPFEEVLEALRLLDEEPAKTMRVHLHVN